jgi:hypothetical protein
VSRAVPVPVCLSVHSKGVGVLVSDDGPSRPKQPRWNASKFSKCLRAARARLDMPLKVIVTRLPLWAPVLHPATLWRYERGSHVPDLAIFCAIAMAYGIATTELLKAFEEDLAMLPQ